MTQRTVHIIGGGSSLKNFKFERLEDAETIAVNEAALFVPNPTYCISADSGTFKKLQRGYFRTVNNTTWVWVSNANHVTMRMIDGRFMHIKNKFVYNPFTPNLLIRNAGTDGIGFSFKDFKTGYNSGFCAFQLAVLLGYDRICLHGFDLVAKGGATHFHDHYGDKRIKAETLDKFYNNFVMALRTLKEKRPDIEVISCSKISRLNEHVPFKKFEDIHNVEVILSILICSLHQRAKNLERLLQCLYNQNGVASGKVEILVETDDGTLSIGAKRNILMSRAKGKYIAFIDDDDMVVNDYTQQILSAVKCDPDCCSLIGKIHFMTRRVVKEFRHSIQYKRWEQKKGVYYRCPNHLNAVRRSIAMQVPFPDQDKKEDLSFSMRLLPHLETESEIKTVLYNYYTQ